MQERREGRKREQGWRKREGRGVREGRDGVREDGVRDFKEAKVVQRGAGCVQRNAHTNNHKLIDQTIQTNTGCTARRVVQHARPTTFLHATASYGSQACPGVSQKLLSLL